jgi:hypothetical protein
MHLLMAPLELIVEAFHPLPEQNEEEFNLLKKITSPTLFTLASNKRVMS